MLSFCVKFVQTDRRPDGRQENNMPPIFRYGGGGIKKKICVCETLMPPKSAVFSKV